MPMMSNGEWGLAAVLAVGLLIPFVIILKEMMSSPGNG